MGKKRKKRTEKSTSSKKVKKTSSKRPRTSKKPTDEEMRQFREEKSRAKEYIDDPQKATALWEEAMRKAKRNKKRLNKVWDDLMALLRLIRSWIKGEYKEAPWKTILLALGAIIYFVNPFDVIPDFIIAFGYLDDATVIAFVVKSIKGDLDNFSAWEKSSSSQS